MGEFEGMKKESDSAEKGSSAGGDGTGSAAAGADAMGSGARSACNRAVRTAKSGGCGRVAPLAEAGVAHMVAVGDVAKRKRGTESDVGSVMDYV